MELLFALFMTENELIKSNSVNPRSPQVVSGSKLGTSFLAHPFPAEIVSIKSSHEPAAIVPPILSTSKQQNWTPVLLLPSQIFPSIAEGNIVLCKNEGSLSADRGVGSQQGGEPNEVWDALKLGISVPERINAIRT